MHFIAEYYRAGDAAFAQALRERGLSAAQIGTHAGAADTSLMLAVDPRLVRSDKMAAAPVPGDGTAGDPRPVERRARADRRRSIVARSVAAIRAAVGR